MKDKTHISELRRPLGRPRELEDRTATHVNLSRKHIAILDTIKDGISSRGEIIRIAIEDLGNDKKYSRLLSENLQLKNEIKELKKEIKENIKPIPINREFTEYQKERIELIKGIYHGRKLDKYDLFILPIFEDVKRELSLSSPELFNLIKD